MVTAATMGCGCSRTGTGSRPTSGGRVNPSESPGSTPERGFGPKPNGCLTNGLTTTAVAGGRPVQLVHRGVDTGSLRTGDRYSPLWLRRGGQAVRTTASTGVQCDLDGDRDFRFERFGTGSGSSRASSRCSSLNRMCRRRPLATAAARLSRSTNNLPRMEASQELSSAGLTGVRLMSASRFLPPIGAGEIFAPDGSESGAGAGRSDRAKMDASSQTDQCPAALDSSAVPQELVPRPPASRKVQLLKDRDFAELDRMAREVPVSFATSVRSLVSFLGLSANSDLELVRSFYVWIAHHVRYDVKYSDVEATPEDTLELRAGVSKDYCGLFAEMCRLGDVRAEVIRGFAKGFSHNAGHNFRTGQDGLHSWNAVFLGGSWRLVDCTWGTGIVNSLGRFQERFSEHFFLTDPDVFSWTHFPHDPSKEENYSRYDVKYSDVEATPEDTLELRAGVSKDYCGLFAEMCRLGDVRAEVIRGFAKGFSHNAGHNFRTGQDGLHSWNAVFLGGSWRLVDCTWGTGIVNSLGRFQERFSEHFFLTDPDVFSWTHFPHDPSKEENYSRWQLTETPLTLDRFNALPKVLPHFFEYGLRIRKPVTSSPLSFAFSTELVLSSPLLLRYKYKLYPAEAAESHRLDQYVFCQLTHGRLRASFGISPPDDGDYALKVYAGPEDDQRPESVLHCVVAFALRCTKTRKNVPRYPPNDLPWGVTRHLAEYGLKVLNVSTPVMTVVTGHKCLLLETGREVLLTHQLTDVQGREMPSKNTVGRTEDKEQRLVRFLIQPPEVGHYKFALYACPKPAEQGRWRLPCVATYLVDCRQTMLAGVEMREQVSVKKTKKAN